MESVRTARGPRSRVVAYLGALPEAERRGVARTAEGHPPVQGRLFEKSPEWVEVDASRVRVERLRDFGGPWLGQELLRHIGLDAFFSKAISDGREEIPWAVMAQVLVVSRLCDPSSELHIAEHFYHQSALPDLLGIPAEKINDDRLYRALDQVLPHKEALERHLKERLGSLFDLDYDLLLYDVTSTYFDLRIRPIWHQKPERVQAHILVCFLATCSGKPLHNYAAKPAWEISPEKCSTSSSTSASSTSC